MNQQGNKNEELPKIINTQGFNWSLFLGLCILSISVFTAGNTIANRIPHSLHGNLSGHLSMTDGGNSLHAQEFLTEWEAARFIGMHHEEFVDIIESGELAGTYTVFQLERRVWIRSGSDFFVVDGPAQTALPRDSALSMEYEIILSEHRVFSRERLSEWMLRRIGNH